MTSGCQPPPAGGAAPDAGWRGLGLLAEKGVERAEHRLQVRLPGDAARRLLLHVLEHAGDLAAAGRRAPEQRLHALRRLLEQEALEHRRLGLA